MTRCQATRNDASRLSLHAETTPSPLPLDGGGVGGGGEEPRASQDRAPILETIEEYLEQAIYPFHTPGHKGGRFAPPELADAWGAGALRFDLPAMTATDNTLHPTGCVADAQRLAAELFGAAETYFLVGGASQGIAAMVLAAVAPGQTILLPRNVHRSVASALVLSGARPRFLPQPVLPECGALGFSAEDLDAALADQPKPAAVLVTRPTYYGLAADVTELVAVCRRHGVLLLVDEAHGSHLRFLPEGGPQPALEAGADVVVQSCHKTLGSMVGAALLHVGRDSRLEPARLRETLNLLQSTSPNYLMLASLDAARRHMWRCGRELFEQAAQDADALVRELSAFDGIAVLQTDKHPRLAGYRRDPLRVVVNVAETGWTGYEVERHLRTEHRVEDEFADSFNIVLVLSPNDDPAARERLLEGFRSISLNRRPEAPSRAIDESHLLQPPIPPLLLSPREAVLGPFQVVPLAKAVGFPAAETVTFYPPGIPLLMPGEEVTAETVAVCQELLAAGATCYAADTTLATLKIAAALVG